MLRGSKKDSVGPKGFVESGFPSGCLETCSEYPSYPTAPVPIQYFEKLLVCLWSKWPSERAHKGSDGGRDGGKERKGSP